MPLVSIIVPTYNSEKFIVDAIKSVIKQSFSDWEMIIVDDCSTDKTVEISESLVTDYNNVKLLKHQENLGTGPTRNTGIEHSLGRYIAFLDADDVWLPAKLEKQISFMQSNDIGISFTSYSFIGSDGNAIRGRVNAVEQLDLDGYMRATGIGLSTAIIDREKCGDIRFANMRVRQDTYLWLSLLSNNHIAYGINECLVKYRISSGQISGNKFKIAWKTFLLYWGFDVISRRRRLVNYLFYIVNAVLKRLK